jgi:hypothetical protein
MYIRGMEKRSGKVMECKIKYVYQSEFDFLQESDGMGTGQTEDILNISLFQNRL